MYYVQRKGLRTPYQRGKDGHLDKHAWLGSRPGYTLLLECLRAVYLKQYVVTAICTKYGGSMSMSMYEVVYPPRMFI